MKECDFGTGIDAADRMRDLGRDKSTEEEAVESYFVSFRTRLWMFSVFWPERRHRLDETWGVGRFKQDHIRIITVLHFRAKSK